MRILFTTDQVYLHGGIEKVMATKANYFSEKLGHEVIILTTEQKGNSSCYTLSESIKIEDLGINYHREKSYFHPSNIRKVVQHFSKWKKAIRNLNPDVIIVCNYAFDFYWVPFFSGKRTTIKEYHSSRYYSFEQRKKAGFLQRLKFKINDFIESKYSRIAVLNNDEKQFYLSKNITVIPNPIEKSDFKAELVSTKAIAAGRIAPIKGFENLIEVWRLVVNRHPNWAIDIYGQGDENYISQLQKKSKENKLENHVFFKTATNDLQKTMLDYSMYLMTSHSECFPMVLLESMNVGLPIVSFNCPTGPRNIVTNNEDGLLAEDQNVIDLANKICFLIENENIRKQMGERSKENIQRFYVQNVMNNWEQLFSSNKE
ncbi:glycosyltransferase family 4 protein [Flavobacterium sp.]|uniref:glycosyltransferase family 4 protein n=1 Tax=Flavobacterium sp. TaxID=239 RepID=UPI002B4AE497|nr:glycosyltransferase family 4 protein [Flavobacterium sp.]HLP65543.1 glycosyltransferase family 4 protein [Flavobacterium sp.]